MLDDIRIFHALADTGSGGGASGPETPRDPQKFLSNEEFAALGDDEIVYRRNFRGADLKRLFPAAAGAPDGQDFIVLFGAGGAPRFISDDEGQADEWIAQAGLSLVTRH